MSGKGTVWYFSDIVTAVTTLMTTLFMLFVAALILFVLNAQLDVLVIGGLMYDEPKADTALLTYLDSTSGEHSMSELLAYSVETGSTTSAPGGDLSAASQGLMDKITDRAYKLTLTSSDMTVTLASAGKPESVENVKAETVVQGGVNEGRLVLVIAK